MTWDWLDTVRDWLIEFWKWDFGIPLLVLGVIIVVLVRYPRLLPGLLEGRGVEEVSIGITGINVKLAADRLAKANAVWDLPNPDSKDVREWLASLVRIPHILWVYDDPKSVRNEIAALQYLGFDQAIVTTNKQARKHVARRPVDVIVSDIDRKKEGCDAGLRLREDLKGIRETLPPIFYYVGQVDGPFTPAGDPVTNAPIELFRLIGHALDGDRECPDPPEDDDDD